MVLLRAPVILGVCCWICISSAIPFRMAPKDIRQDVRQVDHLSEDKDNRLQYFYRPKRTKSNYGITPDIREMPDYYQHGSTEYDYYNPNSRETYLSEYYPETRKIFPGIKKGIGLKNSPDDNNISLVTIQNSQESSKNSIENSKTSDSQEDYDQDSSENSAEDSKNLDLNFAEPKDSVNSKIEFNHPEKSVLEKWIPTKCSRSARKSSDRYSSSFVNHTKQGLNEDTFPNPGEAEAIKSSSMFVGEDVTLCWIETITIKENKSIQPPKKVVLREFTISFENSATIPEKYLECGKLEGEIEPGCQNHKGKAGLFDVVDEDSKVSKLVNFTMISTKGNIEVRQHKNVRCAVGPVVTKNVIEFKDGSKNSKKRVEIKVSPRMRKVSENGESCSSDQEELGVPPTKGSKVEELLTKRPKAKSEEEFGGLTRKPEERHDEIKEKLEEHDFPAKRPSGKSPVNKRPNEINLNSTPSDVTISDVKGDENSEYGNNTSNGISSDGETTVFQNEVTEVEDSSPPVSLGYTKSGEINIETSTSGKEIIEVTEVEDSSSPESLGFTKSDEINIETSTSDKEIYTHYPNAKSTKPNEKSVEDSHKSCVGESCQSKVDNLVYDKSKDEVSKDDKLKTNKSRDNEPTEKITTLNKETTLLDKDVTRKTLTLSDENRKTTEGFKRPNETEPEEGKENEGKVTNEDKSTTESFIIGKTSTPDDINLIADSTSRKTSTDRKISSDNKKSKVSTVTATATVTEKIEPSLDSKKSEPCSGETCPEVVKPGTINEYSITNRDFTTQETLVPTDEAGSAITKGFKTTLGINNGSIPCEDDDCSSCSGKYCSTESDYSRSKDHTLTTRLPSKDERNLSKTDDTPKSREETTTELPASVKKNNKPLKKELLSSSSTTRKSSNAPITDLENETSVPGVEPDVKGPTQHPTSIENEKRPTLEGSQTSVPEITSLRPSTDNTNVPDILEEASTKSPRSMLTNSFIRDKVPKNDSKCKSKDCSTTSEGLTEFPEDSSKPESLIEPSKDGFKYPEGSTQSNKDASKPPVIRSDSSEEKLISFEETTKFFDSGTSKTDESPTESSKNESKSDEATSAHSESTSKYSKGKPKFKEMPESTAASMDLERITLSPTDSGPRSTVHKEKNEKKEKYEPNGSEDESFYSDEEESISSTPSFVDVTISPSEKLSKNPTKETDSLSHRSGKEIPDEVPKTTTEMYLIDTTTSQCPPDDKECFSKSKTSSSESVSTNCNSFSSQGCLESKESKEKSTTSKSKEMEVLRNRNIPSTIENKTTPSLPSTGKHRLGLRIKILLEHINENEEKKNLVEVDKHLLLHEDPNEHDNNTILNQIKTFNDSVTAQTIKALLNCTTLEKLSNKGFSIEVDEATLVPKKRVGSKNVEPNELILSIEDKKSDGGGLSKLRRKRETSDVNSKDANSTEGSFTGGNSVTASSIDVNPTNSTETKTTEANTTEANIADQNSTEAIRTEANSTNCTDKRSTDKIENKNQSQIIKDCLPDLQEDINTGINHVISKLENCTTLKCFSKAEDGNLLSISDILGIISNPTDSRIHSRTKRDAEGYTKGKQVFEKVDKWSNERLRRDSDGHHLRSLTEFTIFKEA